MYSLEVLNVRDNSIIHIEQVWPIGDLPCLVQLQIDGNPVQQVVEYRTRVLEAFGSRAHEVISNFFITLRISSTVKLRYNIHPRDRTIGVCYIEVYGISRCTVYRGVWYIEVYGISRCTVYRGVWYIEVYVISKFDCINYSVRKNENGSRSEIISRFVIRGLFVDIFFVNERISVFE